MTDEKKTETAKEAATVKKAMISQPMAGKTDEEIAATRDLAVAKLRQMGYEVVNTLFTDEWYSDEAMEERGAVLYRTGGVPTFKHYRKRVPSDNIDESDSAPPLFAVPSAQDQE